MNAKDIYSLARVDVVEITTQTRTATQTMLNSDLIDVW